MSRCTLDTMPYPAKTSPRAILEEAMKQVERDGAEGLSMRAVAAALRLAPNALYRYYIDRDALLAAVTDEGTRSLLTVLEDATRGLVGAAAVRALAAAYLGFARMRPALYRTIMTEHDFPAGSRPAHEDLWVFAAGLFQDVAGEEAAAEATVAVWGLLHGIAGLERVVAFDERKPQGGVDFALEAMLKGMARPGSALGTFGDQDHEGMPPQARECKSEEGEPGDCPRRVTGR